MSSSPPRSREPPLDNKKRERPFDCICYTSEEQLKIFLDTYKSQIRHYAYAFHDKDVKENGEPKEPHFHLLLYMHNGHTLSAICKMFYRLRFRDEDDKLVNFRVIRPNPDLYTRFVYLWHMEDPDKYQYSMDIVKTDDFSFFGNLQCEVETDVWNSMVDDMLDMVDYRTLRKRYGQLAIRNVKILEYWCEREKYLKKFC